jgi:ribosomal protein S18 acetylase RimI-like enzyme
MTRSRLLGNGRCGILSRDLPELGSFGLAAAGRGGPTSANFIASERGVDVGLAAVFAEPDASGRMHLVSMWVDPRYRRRGVARALVDQAVGWAAERRAHEVILWVADHNTAARRLYERIGFQPTGARQPLPSNPARTESLLRLSLGDSLQTPGQQVP